MSPIDWIVPGNPPEFSVVYGSESIAGYMRKENNILGHYGGPGIPMHLAAEIGYSQLLDRGEARSGQPKLCKGRSLDHAEEYPERDGGCQDCCQNNER